MHSGLMLTAVYVYRIFRPEYEFLFIHDDERIARLYFSAPAHTEPQPACKFKLKLTTKFPCKINSVTPNIYGISIYAYALPIHSA